MTETDRLRARLLGPRPTDRLAGWIVPILIAAWAGVVRFWNLGFPGTLVFDETYYVKQAWSLVEFGHENKVLEKYAAKGATPGVDDVWAAGTSAVFDQAADFVVHPPVGKWVIASGELLFGVDSSVGWRFSVAVLGTLSVLMMARTARRMFGSTTLGAVAGILLAVDGQHFVLSRTGLLDMSVMFFAFAAFCALVVDRDAMRERLAVRVGALRESGAGPDDRRLRYGPALGVRPWRLLAAVSLGLCIGTKWSGLYFLAAFGLLTVFWDMGARRAAGIRRWWVASVLRSAPVAALAMCGTAGAVYVATWAGWFATDGGWDRHWATSNPASGAAALVPDVVRSFAHYHGEMWRFHVGLHTPHVYQSNPWSWIVQGRPTSFYYVGTDTGCGAEKCSRAITDLGNPLVWWAGALSLAVLVGCWAWRRDWRAGAILAGYAGGYLPWFQYQERTIYTFYSVAFVPWVVLGVTYCLGLVVGAPDASRRRRRIGLALAGAYVVAAVAVFVFFWPVYTGELIPYEHWSWRMWFPSWI
ncbi:dolichyl-phosphate-mannose--protein mannosyltransferase [Agilicoccus flavus]|uniref:dolichyl-phosphate-mannose--protein mannosyltransferase n=1 Tax=Agilicoccus flavus TaxID=2775968 RepID=UPI001CF6BFA8|nr:phospholipid carrier-dependent glycosyltransferase [Agilicoccus flavus]